MFYTFRYDDASIIVYTEKIIRFFSCILGGFCVRQIAMTTAWLLLLLIVSCQSVDSQSTTDDEETCDGGNVLTKMQTDIATMLNNQQQLFQTISNRLGNSTTDNEETWDGGNVLTKMQTDIATMLNNQQQLFQTIQTISNRLGKFQFRTTYFCVKFSRQTCCLCYSAQ